MDTLVPTFEVGDRVRVTPRPNAEFACPHCGALHGAKYPADKHEIGTVSGEGTGRRMRCEDCRGEYVVAPGIYGVLMRDGYLYALPYTWLERIEEGES